jgi:hypothetical protein
LVGQVADDFAEKTWRVKFDAAKMTEAEDTAKELGMWGDVLIKFKQLSNSWIFKPLRPYFEVCVFFYFKKIFLKIDFKFNEIHYFHLRG